MFSLHSYYAALICGVIEFDHSSSELRLLAHPPTYVGKHLRVHILLVTSPCKFLSDCRIGSGLKHSQLMV